MSKTDGDTLTATEAAKILQCSPSSVRKAVDQGLVPGWLHPGTGGHRRFSRKALIQYAREHGIPVDGDEQ